MKINKSYKTELSLNNKQKTKCKQHCGVVRFAYNWGLSRRMDEFRETGSSSNSIKLNRDLNALKKIEFPWMYESSKCAPQEALRDLDKAFNNFFKGRAKYPNFKSKKHGVGSFRLTGRIKVFENGIQLPKLGRLKLKERCYLPLGSHILSATVSELAGKWFVSINVEEDIDVPKDGGEVVGVDLGVKTLATVSDGTKFDNPKALKSKQRKLRKQQKEVSRKKKGSNNRKKSIRKLQRIHYKISNIRKDAIHKTTTYLAKTKSVVVLEDLDVSGMLKNNRFAKDISDVGFHEFKRQMEYKSKWYGSEVNYADRFYPSSKMCSSCGNIKDDLKLSNRIYRCKECCLVMDRDLNASINLRKLAVSSPESLNACGDSGSGLPNNQVSETTTMNQEYNTKSSIFG